MTDSIPDFLRPSDAFSHRHIGPSDEDVRAMLAELGSGSLDELIARTVPRSIRRDEALELGAALGESAMIAQLRAMAAKNRVLRSCIGMGYHDCIVPPVIQRNVLESPGWYTQYTPYQAEISQGRLEALLNYQTMVADLCALPLANASLLDEATAAAEAMYMCHAVARGKRTGFFVSQRCHPQTIAVVRTRAESVGIPLHVGDEDTFDFEGTELVGALVQYPATDGEIRDYAPLAERLHAAGALFVVAADLLALTLLRAPGEFGADVAVGSAQRFGVPLGYGGPHAAFLATRDEFKRLIPGRIIGLSRDAHGGPALRMALQTREQHIRRDKATSNICTAQVLLAIMSGFYAVYHGPAGLRRIAQRAHGMAKLLAAGLRAAGRAVAHETFFDTLRVPMARADAERALAAAGERGYNLRLFEGDGGVGISLDETTSVDDVARLLATLGADAGGVAALAHEIDAEIPSPHARTSSYLTHEVFHRYRSEHELLRYIHRLQGRDLSLTHAMIPLGSCTMKLNATTEMLPVTWPEFGGLHPFAPLDQTAGYSELFERLEASLAEITGFAAISLQPNAGSQGEYTGLLVIRAYHRERGDDGRNVCLIPVSAHGTNPASAVMAGMKVVGVACDEEGNIDVEDLRTKAERHRDTLAALMVTYPSTHGVFEEAIVEICDVVHQNGGQVYMDGANLNAQVGVCRPADFGADVCHLNLHKTFCIPHGGGGPGMGPIGVREHLARFLPGHPIVPVGGANAVGAVSAAPWGSPSILTISWAYIAMMGAVGLRRATEVAILNANYMAHRLAPHFRVLYRGEQGRVAHEFIIDLRSFERTAGILVEDVAKRLMDFGFHSPTMSFPVAGTLMIEPTESETRAELDRLCEALIAIRGEIQSIESGELDRVDNPLQHAPHTAAHVTADAWEHAYPREQAAYPLPWVRERKFWPSVARVDNGYGDRHLICTCPPVGAFDESMAEAPARDLALERT